MTNLKGALQKMFRKCTWKKKKVSEIWLVPVFGRNDGEKQTPTVLCPTETSTLNHSQLTLINYLSCVVQQ